MILSFTIPQEKLRGIGQHDLKYADTILYLTEMEPGSKINKWWWEYSFEEYGLKVIVDVDPPTLPTPPSYDTQMEEDTNE
jgi:hypothetical protein